VIYTCALSAGVYLFVSTYAATKCYVFVVWRSRYVGQEAGVTNKWLDSRRLAERHTPLTFVVSRFRLLPNLALRHTSIRYIIVMLRKDNLRVTMCCARFCNWPKRLKLVRRRNRTVDSIYNVTTTKESYKVTCLFKKKYYICIFFLKINIILTINW